MGDVSTALAQKQQQAQTEQRTDPVRALVMSMAPALQRALPRHIDSERYARIAITAIRSTPKLGECLATQEGKMSLLGALMESAQLGLEPGVLGSCWILPFRKSFKDDRGQWRKRMEAQFVVGYRGMVDLARRTGEIMTIYANELCENDQFEMSYGVGGTLKHTPNLRGDRGEVIGYYAFAALTGGDGAYQYVYWPKESVIEHAKKHSQTWGQDTSPWTQHFDSMAKKTMIRQLFKTLPVSVERVSGDRDEKVIVAKVDNKGELAEFDTFDVVDVEPEPSEPPKLAEAPTPEPTEEVKNEAPQAEPTPEPKDEPMYPHTGAELARSSVNKRTINALAKIGVTSVDDVYSATNGLVGDDGVAQLAKIDGVGPDGAASVLGFCAACEEAENSEGLDEAKQAYAAGEQAKASKLMKSLSNAEKAVFAAWCSGQKSNGGDT